MVIDIESGLTRELEIQRGIGFEYHIHVKQVGANNNCEATGGHLDPDPSKPGVVPCDPYAPDECQVGDLSGNHRPFLCFFFYKAHDVDMICRVCISALSNPLTHVPFSH